MLETEEVTLIVKHLPQRLSTEHQAELLKRLGAIDVNIPKTAAAVRNGLAFATFERHSHAEALLRTLHQKKLLGRCLSVEWARGRRPDDGVGLGDAVEASTADNERTGFRRAAETFRERLVAWAPHLDFTQPPPGHLRYRYPPPTTEALSNISLALKRFPRFYTQVLHLMNRMNLPCPFSEDFSLDGLEICGQAATTSTVIQGSSEEESELESDSEGTAHQKEIIPSGIKRPSGKIRPRIKRPKLGLLPLPASSGPALRPQEVFEQQSTTLATGQKKIELKLETLLDSLLEASGSEKPVRKDDEPDKKDEIMDESTTKTNNSNSMTVEELQRNRISSKDFHMLPVFKNYQAGLPTNRLYIKNLAKGVEASDLEAIYQLFTTAADSTFVVKVMSTGRMKGQAFVTFSSNIESKRALEETNGYILKNKPMFVQFARSSNS